MSGKGYHFHLCVACETVWKHSDIEHLRPPDAHNCPKCGVPEFIKYTLGDKRLLPVYCTLPMNGWVHQDSRLQNLTEGSDDMSNGVAYQGKLGDTVEITNGPLEGCRAKLYRRVTKLYWQATLLDAMLPWEVGETVSLGPGCYKLDGEKPNVEGSKGKAGKAVIIHPPIGPKRFEGKNILKKGKG